MSILEIIKYEGDNTAFAWKHPKEDFNTLSTLIVNESQEAIFFTGGQARDVFGPGKHTLETKNIPLLRRFINIPTGGKSPFHCQVYFINKSVQMALKWGTDTKVRFFEPTFGIPVEIGACGEMNLTVSDSIRLVTKLVGTMKGISWEEGGAGFIKSVQVSFRPMISTMVKSELSSAIKSLGIDILEIDEHLAELSARLRESISKGFEEYGLTVPEFYITTVTLPENDVNFKRVRDLHTVNIQTKMANAEALVKSAQADAEADVVVARRRIELERQTTETEIARREAERDLIKARTEAEAAKMAGVAEAEVMAAKGYNQKDIITADVQKAYAEGIGSMSAGGSGGVVGEFVSLGVGMAAASAVAPQVGEMMKGFSAPTVHAQAEPRAKCVKCGATLAQNAKFCPECGEKIVSTVSPDMIVCPQCAGTVSKGKFCPECGYKFVTVCPKCSASAAPGAKFCAECGEKL